MNMASASVFRRPSRQRSGSKKSALYDAEGNEVEVETREDEEQNVKLGETIELLLAAGYFRARIKGLSPFDKVVGGMTWCITTCNFDIDVDLLFQENSTIGQKIALTEKIVAVLPRMKCPHRIEPHQIQGLDFIHIYPVVQWLVKRAIETREEMGDQIRAFSISQFSKNHKTPEDMDFEDRKDSSISAVGEVKNSYKAQRRYKRADAYKLKEEELRVQSTLLEYGRRYGMGGSSQNEKEAEKDPKRKAVAAGLSPASQPDKAKDAEEERLQEERRIQALMKGMAAMQVEEGKVTASMVGSIVGLQSDVIGQLASEYADKKSELQQLEEKPERMSGAQQHQRIIGSLQKQITTVQKKVEESRVTVETQQQEYNTSQQRLQEVEEYSARIDQEMAKLDELGGENKTVLAELRGLVAMNESLKKQEQEFRAHCKEEMQRLKQSIAELQEAGGGETQLSERDQLIAKQYEADKEKLQKIRLLLARKNREISQLQRKIDKVPTRAELTQYQKRFVELYNQVASTHRETKQFYTLYNTLDDTKLYLEKEVSLLNSIYDNFEKAMSSSAGKDQFLKQFEQIVAGVKQNFAKVEKKKQEEKMKRDQNNDTFLDLVEKQRLYFKTVKEFQEECRKNEILLSKLSAAD
ncbi:coiled-coil domain-containing protein 93-like [Diadema antillarum]|uniref:coiled-coil domain-containing protein 93-like n=1 Tax=Diadema antillarum TaxID=105358 RepID=UPI003A838A36